MMSASKVTSSALLALALALVSPIAFAEPTAAERETARTLLLSGRDKKKAGKLKDALNDFERANGIMHVPTTALDLGKAQEALGLLVEARASFLEAARFPTTSDESRAFKKASLEGKQLADAITPRLASLTVNAPASAKVKVDDAELSASSIGTVLKLNPGKHEVVATIGSDEKRQSVELEEGEQRSVSLAPAETDRVPDTTEDKPADVRPSKTVKQTSPLVWAGGAVAVVGIGVGAITGLLTIQHRNTVLPLCVLATNGTTQCPPSTFNDIDSGHTLGTVSTVSFVIGGIGAAMLVYGLLTPTQVPASTPAASVSVRVTPFGLAGTF